jgi:putative endonuclease
MPKQTKQAINGKYGEKLAADYLIAHGFEISQTNYRSRFGEIDIIARKDDMIIFVEVKSLITNTIKAPSMQVDERKQIKLAKTALQYISENEENDEFNYRFDVIEILNDKINHIENAFDMPENMEI